MKIRWTENSIRLRISPGELSQLCNRVPISQSIEFPGGGSWRIEIVPSAHATTLVFEVGTVRIYVSPADTELLNAPEKEGLYFTDDGANGLRYFIEKDFPCAHPRPSEARERDTETFSPPAGFEERKLKAGS
jgi:hypothetical protein